MLAISREGSATTVVISSVGIGSSAAEVRSVRARDHGYHPFGGILIAVPKSGPVLSMGNVTRFCGRNTL